MNGVRLTSDYNLIIRKQALQVRAVSIADILAALETERPLDEDQALLSFGPLFGEEALRELTDRLEQLGLVYEEDFFGIAPVLPEWCQLSASLIQG